MAKRELPSPDLLRQILDYNPITGAMIWRFRRRELFQGIASGYVSWNKRYHGVRADRLASGPQTEGYRRILIRDKAYSAHRIAWAIFYGIWPTEQLDHINGDRADNRIENLREVSATENRRNRGSNPEYGVLGVYRIERQSGVRWSARISEKNRSVYIGTYSSFEEAVTARKEAEVRLGYHPNHGQRDCAKVSRLRR